MRPRTLKNLHRLKTKRLDLKTRVVPVWKKDAKKSRKRFKNDANKEIE
jgi:hypothetical protein